jgi:hypothetical protein
MKKLAFALLAATVLVSCKKSDEVNETPLTSPGMVAKIGGTEINYGVPSAEKQESTSGTETVFVSAFTTDGNSVTLSLTKDGGINTGTYNAASGAVVGISDPVNYYETENNVSIKITSIDATHIVGFFSGTAVDGTVGGTKTITEGKFYANF